MENLLYQNQSHRAWHDEFPDYGGYTRKPSSYPNTNLFINCKLILAHTINRDVFLTTDYKPYSPSNGRNVTDVPLRYV